MRHVKNNWPVALVAFLFCVLGAAFWIFLPQRQAAAEGGGVTPLAAEDWFAMGETFREAGLSDANLTALNVTAVQAENILAAARQWCEDNTATLTQRKVNVGAKRTAVRELERQVAAGPRSQQVLSSLATAQQELATAQAQYEQTLQGLRSTVSAQLSESQQSLWSVLRAGEKLPLPDRLLALTDEQQGQLTDARRIYRARLLEAEDQAARAQAGQWHDTQRSQILTESHQQMLESYEGYAQQSSVSVGQGWTEALPLESS